MAFDGSEGGQIALVKAAAMTKEHRRRSGSATLGHFFGRDAFLALLEQPGCVGIRIYYGMNTETGEKELIIDNSRKTLKGRLNFVSTVAVFPEPSSFKGQAKRPTY